MQNIWKACLGEEWGWSKVWWARGTLTRVSLTRKVKPWFLSARCVLGGDGGRFGAVTYGHMCLLMRKSKKVLFSGLVNLELCYLLCHGGDRACINVTD